MTLREGGVSAAPYASFNLGSGVGDDPVAVAHNRQRLQAACGAQPVFIEQVHGTRVVRLTAADGTRGAPVHVADASVTSEPGLACAVLVADCLPVLFAAPGGRAVGAAHAGWRGLAHGVLEATLAELCQVAGCPPAAIGAWLGPCIGPARFEVGPEVVEACGGPSDRFVPGQPGKWFADLAGLAADRLRAAGVKTISADRWCTATDRSRFFSYRRDRLTGRQAALVWIDPRPSV